jgi:hypothetical protein
MERSVQTPRHLEGKSLSTLLSPVYDKVDGRENADALLKRPGEKG